MKLKKETHYSIKAIRALYKNKSIKSLQAKEIADLENIPVKFLYPILRKLNKEHLITIKRGINGVYKPTNNLDELTLYDLLILIEGDISLSFCNSNKDCKSNELCAVSNILTQIDDGIKKALDNIKIINII